MGTERSKEMKYIVKIRYMEFAFNIGAEALNFAERAKASLVKEEKFDNDVVIELVNADAQEN